MFAFLKTIPPVHNPVADPKVPKPVQDGMMKVLPGEIAMLDAMRSGKPMPPPAAAAPSPAAPAAAPAAPAPAKK